MVLPYQRLSTLGKSTILCGSKGATIYTFDLESYTLLSSWSHPLSKNGEPNASVDEAGQADGQASVQPPSKKRRIESNGEAKAEEAQPTEVPVENSGSAANGNGNGNLNSKGRGKKQKPKHSSRPPQEQPFVILMTSTSDGSHVIAVTGSDKTLWVLEHDGKGGLKESSQRAMPKRPSSVALTADGKTILCADKFGDVYSLPLVPSSSNTPETTKASSPASVPAPVTQVNNKPKGANKFTVHSKRNLRALEDQEKSRNSVRDTPKEGPSFEHELVLGHVSMLTAIKLASLNGRSYILTANRDEQIRVSRGIPQAYVIENFCLGHKAFINALCIPPSEPGLLVSGGGDDELYVWNWLDGKLLSKVDLLSYVREEVDPTAQNIAVSDLYCYETRQGPNIVAICERVPAIFIFRLQHNTLVHVQTTQLSGNPLDVAIVAPESRPQTLVVAIDPAPGTDVEGLGGIPETLDSSLSTLIVEDSGGVSPPEVRLPVVATAGLDISRAELDRVLYSVENLRKTEVEGDDGGDEKSVKEPLAGQREAEAEPMDVGEVA